MAEFTVLSWKSVFNFYEWAASIQGDKSVAMAAIIGNEIEVTKRFRDLQIHPDLEFSNMTWGLATCAGQEPQSA